MADAKIEIKVGSLVFSGEGPDTWLSQQLDKILGKASELAQLGDGDTDAGGAGSAAIPPTKTHPPGKPLGTLAAFLKAKNATTNQTRKFLATALWLHDSENNSRVSTSDVNKALNSHNQGRLGNPSQCLSNNVKSGSVVKDGAKQFYVTPEGRAELEK